MGRCLQGRETGNSASVTAEAKGERLFFLFEVYRGLALKNGKKPRGTSLIYIFIEKSHNTLEFSIKGASLGLGGVKEFEDNAELTVAGISNNTPVLS